MWSIEKLHSYIEAQIEESVHLDYKAAGALSKTNEKKKEISKDVSAFANSDGGIIIYGMKERIDMKHFPEAIDPIKRNDFTKETLEQIINSSISPKIQGVKINPITIGAPENNDVVYVVEIPKSNTAHQAIDKRYYKRYNFQSEMMEDWEIKDIINRGNKSNIKLWLEPLLSEDQYQRFSNVPNYKLQFDLWMQNLGNRSAEYIEIFITGEKADSAFFLDPIPINEGNRFEIYLNNKIDHKITIDGEDFIINSQHIPLLPKVSRHICRITIKSELVISGKPLKLLISTEDGRKAYTKSISEIVYFI